MWNPRPRIRNTPNVRIRSAYVLYLTVFVPGLSWAKVLSAFRPSESRIQG